ncbi:MAG: stage II sporulation protein M [Saprospiraceae bacterium]|nr:stage II sporulation protein M [Saprospiraceae bacterium]
MTETEFVNSNKADWKRLDELLKTYQCDTDELNKLFIKVSGDLSYASTNYPRRMVRVYLNELVIRVFDRMRTGAKKNITQQLGHFFNFTLPKIIIKHRYAFLVSFGIFFFATVIGIYSTLENQDFVSYILGDSYVNMTEKNIKNNDPMAVYKDKDKTGMFVGITLNNIRVAMVTFVFGIFTSLGTGLILLYNGIMLGAFFTFFYNKGLLVTALLTVWIHGTIEISFIIIAGAAGIIMGNSILRPGSYTRTQSLTKGAREAFLVIASTIPMFIIAGFLESFVTRHNDMPAILSLLIIGVSLGLILWVYVINPCRIFKAIGKRLTDNNENDFINGHALAIKKIDETVQAAFVDMNRFYPSYLFKVMPFILIILIGTIILLLSTKDFGYDYYTSVFSENVKDIWRTFLMLTAVCIMLIFATIIVYKKEEEITLLTLSNALWKQFSGIAIASAILVLPLLLGSAYALLIYIAVPPTISFSIVDNLRDDKPSTLVVKEVFSQHYNNFFHSLFISIQTALITLMVYLLMSKLVVSMVMDIMKISQVVFNNNRKQDVFETYFGLILMVVMIIPLIHFYCNHKWKRTYYQKTSEDLADDIAVFVQSKSK